MIWDKFQRVSPRNRTNEPENSPSKLSRNTGTALEFGHSWSSSPPGGVWSRLAAPQKEEPRAQDYGKNEASQIAGDAVV